MTIKQIENFLRERPGYLKKGAGSLAQILEADVKKCKRALHKVRKEVSYPKEKSHDQNLVLRSKWYNGKEWCESYRNVDTDPEPLDKEDWVEIFKEIGSINTITSLDHVKPCGKTLCIWTSDKHIGAAIPSDSLYKRKYNEHIFHERMCKIFDEAIKLYQLHGKFDELVIADLGDSLDGFNGLTTRGGHGLPQNLNNKEAARVHFFTHKWFFESLITSEIAKKITILNVTNDNHSGDFGWQACFGLEQYGSLAWPDVEFINQEEFIGHYCIYDKVFITTHGKDKKNRNRPLPLKINAEVESFIMDYVIDRKLGNYNVHLRKGDIHLNDLDCSRNKFSYFNIGSVFGASDWIMDNFSDTKPSCVFEIIEQEGNNIDAKIIWL
jgi:hypothetical protein